MTTDKEITRKGLDVRDSNKDSKRREKSEINHREYLSELFNFVCVLRGEVKHLEKIKEYIIQKYVDKGLVKLVKPTYDKNEIYLVTENEWEEYQKLKKKKDKELIGYEFM